MDITFTVKPVGGEGEEYSYTLATINGKKAWSVAPIRKPPGHIYDEQIEMVLECRAGNIGRSGASELALVGKMMDELSILAKETDPITLKGLSKKIGKQGEDNKDRRVRIPIDGIEMETVVNETGKDAEYRIKVTCLGLYE